MEIKIICEDLTKYPCDAVVVNLFEGVKSPGGATGAADKALGGLISRLIADGEITGKLNEARVIHTQNKMVARRCAVVGLGKSGDFNYDRIRQVSSESAKALRKLGAKRIATIVHGAGIGGFDAKLASQALAEGTILGLYRFKKYISEPLPQSVAGPPRAENGEIDELAILEREAPKLKEIEEGVRAGKIIADATNFARDLINEPANYLTPQELANKAKEVAQKNGLEYYGLDKDKMWELGMGALLSVAQGSAQPAQLIVLRYDGAEPSQPALGLIGKGVTFDSGGISIKPSLGMGAMKGDMAGAAVVLAAMDAIAQLKPKVNVCAVIPAVENMPGGRASRPGDIVKAMNGKTIEIISTDAEGRMILADAVCYAKKLGLAPIIDVATLTRACAQAVGPYCTGLFGNDSELMDKIEAASEAAGEKLWPLPMYDEYKEMLKSDVADIKNVGGEYAGATTGALFVGFFAENTPWVHLDIAGTSFTEKEETYLPKGGRGVMVRTIVNFITEVK